jgi:hypothetical protein
MKEIAVETAERAQPAAEWDVDVKGYGAAAYQSLRAQYLFINSWFEVEEFTAFTPGDKANQFRYHQIKIYHRARGFSYVADWRTAISRYALPSILARTNPALKALRALGQN